MFTEYLFLLNYLLFAFLVAAGLFFLSIFFVFHQPDNEKLSSYECGFNPFSDARSKFDVRFYLVGILFIIFDLEISYLFPWILAIESLSFLGIFGMLIFIFILTVGFIYEWVNGALDWK